MITNDHVPGTGPRLKMFQACIPIFRVDIQVSQYLLPYLVQNVVAHGSDEAVKGVRNEVRASKLAAIPSHSTRTPHAKSTDDSLPVPHRSRVRGQIRRHAI